MKILKQKAIIAVAYISRLFRGVYGNISRAFWRTRTGRYIRDRKWLQRSLCGLLVTGFVLSIILTVTSSASAAVTWRSSASASTGGATTIVINTPTGAVEGDVLIASIVARHSGQLAFFINQSAGWTSIGSTLTGGSAADIRHSTFYHVVTASTSASHTFSFTDCGNPCTVAAVSVKSAGSINAYTGSDTTNPVDVSASQANASSTNKTAPSVTPTLSGGYLLSTWGVPGLDALTVPGDMTERNAIAATGGSGATRATLSVADKPVSSTSPTGTKISTGAASVSTGHSIVIKPTAPASLEQSVYRWFNNKNEGNFQSVVSNPTTAADAAYNSYIDGEFIYTGGYEGVNANDWRVEKRSIHSGKLDNGFGTGGVVKSNPSANNDRLYYITGDSNYIYTTGYDGAAGSTNSQWRIEKRDKITGALVNAFGTNGVVTSNPTTGNDDAYIIKVDGSDLYIFGADTGGGFQTRIEKRDSTTGALVNGFGTNGVLTSNPSAGIDTPTAAVISSSAIYMGGVDATVSSSDSSWRIEKRDKITGALISGFGTNGVISTNISPGLSTREDSVMSGGMALDGNGNIFVAGTDGAPGNVQWRIEKRTETTGAFVSGFGTNGVVQVNPGANDDLINGFGYDGTHIYAAGTDRTPDGGFSQMRLEKRDAISGALVNGFGTGGIVNYNPSTNHDEARSVSLSATDVYVAGYDLIPGNYQWTLLKYDKTTGGVPKSPLTPLAAQSTSTSNVAIGAQFRLRAGAHVTTAALDSGTSYKLQYAQRSGSCDTTFSGETYADVSTSSPIAFYDNTDIDNNTRLYDDPNMPVHGTDPYVLQTYVEQNNFSALNSVPIGSDSLWDFSLVNTTAPGGTNYCFRIVNSDGSALNTYTVIPEMSTQPSVLNQASYRLFEDAVGTPQPSMYTFAKKYGGANREFGEGIVQTSDGGYATVSSTNTYTAGGTEVMLSKYSSDGTLEFSRTVGSTVDDGAYGVDQTTDGGYVVAGHLNSGASDAFVSKFTSTGTLSYTRYWGGSSTDFGYAVTATSDGGFALTGLTYSFGTGGDMFMAKYDSSGTLEFSRSWGTANADEGNSIKQTADGGYIVAGSTGSFGAYDGFIAKYDALGNHVFSRTWGGTNDDKGVSVTQVQDGSYIVTGTTRSYGAGNGDMYVVKFSSVGAFEYFNTWGGAGNDDGKSIDSTSDGGYVIAGSTDGYGAGSIDAVLAKFDNTGSLSFVRTFGTVSFDNGSSAVQTTDGGYVLTGYVPTGANEDTLIAKFDSSGTMSNCASMCSSPAVPMVSHSATNNTPSPTLAARTPVASSITASYSSPSPATTVVLAVVETPVTAIDVGAPLAVQNQKATLTTSNQIFRLRLNINTTSGGINAGGQNFKLQFAGRGADGVCDASFTGETYADVSTSSAISFYDNVSNANGGSFIANANDPTYNATSLIRQTFNESNPSSIVNNILVNQTGMWDYSLRDNNSGGGTYCLRIVKNDGSQLNTYLTIPEVTTFATNSIPTAPTLSSPAGGATNVSINPVFNLKATDADNDYLRYRIQVCSNSTCSAVVRTIDQTASQTGWTGQDTQTGTAYVGNATLSSSTLASHTYQAPALSNSTQYWWRAYAIDPAGSNTLSSASSISSFTTQADANTRPIDIRGGTILRGGTRFGN